MDFWARHFDKCHKLSTAIPRTVISEKTRLAPNLHMQPMIILWSMKVLINANTWVIWFQISMYHRGLGPREGKNQEDLIGSKMDLLCEPDASGLLADLLCTLWTSSGPATSIKLPPSDFLWQCLPRTSCGCASLGPPVAMTPSKLFTGRQMECIWLILVKQIARKCKISIHSRSRGTQQVQILFCYLTLQVHTGGPFSDLIRPSWFLPLMRYFGQEYKEGVSTLRHFPLIVIKEYLSICYLTGVSNWHHKLKNWKFHFHYYLQS